MSKRPGVKNGPFEIRPAANLTEIVRESERRRAGHQLMTRRNRDLEAP